MAKTLVYVLKIAAILLLSLLLWGMFMGRPTRSSRDGTAARSAEGAVTLNEYATRGAYIEELLYGTTEQGAKRLYVRTWCELTGVNGLATEVGTYSDWNGSVNGSNTTVTTGSFTSCLPNTVYITAFEGE